MKIVVDMPEWIEQEMSRRPSVYPELADRIKLVVEFSRLNVVHDTGGPFGAGVFELETGKLVSIAVNRVVPCSVSCAHAEFGALALAQQKLGTFDLGGAGLPAHQLVVNWRPCTMCYGSVIWSGVRSLALAGSGKAVEEITGFDEGPIADDWIEELNRRGIEVHDNQDREAALEVFRLVRDSGQLVYNARLG
ncbi:CMP deaminase [bacterium SCN 62-11]|nr:MAG: CMP deaminase [bacterium SCN 62-11]